MTANGGGSTAWAVINSSKSSSLKLLKAANSETFSIGGVGASSGEFSKLWVVSASIRILGFAVSTTELSISVLSISAILAISVSVIAVVCSIIGATTGGSSCVTLSTISCSSAINGSCVTTASVSMSDNSGCSISTAIFSSIFCTVAISGNGSSLTTSSTMTDCATRISITGSIMATGVSLTSAGISCSFTASSRGLLT